MGHPEWDNEPIRTEVIVRIQGLLVVVSLGLILSCDNVENLKSKEEYGVLQVVEHAHRQTPVSDLEIVEQSGYLVAGFPADGGKQNVWVLLNARYRPYYKQIPAGPVRVSYRALEVIRGRIGVRKDVLSALETHAVEGQGK